ncbi:Rne/Rng family ribonuclease [Leucobacter sp. CSA1]|uniref:Ribonuclease E n=1 Tax=Leucobacter chromiisoli TaxID=2796471 RepID=A0A934Q9S7_9MICO|nr:Rne/Rng family ribonuclease [Leucobacter chromiisoli]MBK0419152.1 Rne/Rng family ribonuclease [Leucobacter chromiisoli]
MVNRENHDETTESNPEGELQPGAASAPQESRPDAPQVEAEQQAASDELPSTAEAAETGIGESSEGAEAAAKDETSEPPLVLPLSEMSPEERFRATTRLIFLAPDVPPVQPRPRRGELRQLDDLLDQQFSRDESEDRESGSSRRRSRRRSGGEQPEEEPARRQRTAPVITEPQKVKGSTRLEAKKQRRRDGRDAGRRRMVITESEFLARRESVDREMVVRTTADRIQIGVLEDKVLVEHYVARSSETSLIGNVYLGRVQNVLPSMEAAFVDIGRGRNAVLYSGEVDWSEFEGGNTARKIENALKPGDPVLVQVTKDPVGHKGARLTSQISLPGRFLVYVPGGAMNGISRKLPDTERARLKKILKEVLPTGAGVIVRTAAEGATEEQLTHDVQRLTRQWESIQKRTQKGGGPVLLHSEPDMLIKIIRDVFNEDFHKLVISGSETYRVIEDYLSQVAPDLLQRVERYENDRDVFDEYRVTEQIAKALDRKVWLPSGGSLVIDRTEAMTVIDVNTGKFVGSGGNLEETVTKNNLEAAEEIVRQLRLRDIGGIIVVDFIDMVLESNRDLVLRRLVECLSRDRTKHQVAEVTSLGLVQMTRKKLGLGLLESFSEPCDVCAGRGLIVHHEPVSKHRSEGGGSRGKRGGKGGSQQQAAPQHAPSQTHAISDGAKNMLAQVAASTIGGAKPAEAEADHQRPEATSERAQTPAHAPAQTPEAPSSAPASRADDLLGSVLDALPDAPPAGRGRAKSRRVTTPPVRGGSGAVADDAQAARLALAQALDATATAKRAEEQ